MSAFLRLLRPAPLLGLAAAALAQAPPDPLDATAAVPALRHESVVTGHRRPGEPALASWRASNATVERIGGWRSYAREAHAPAPGASQPSSTPAHSHPH
ncbi:MAG TPA: hypothetical protein VNV16_10485 [Methylibium sp.]|nr:hypothetical protein [Methylibium sp.]